MKGEEKKVLFKEKEKDKGEIIANLEIESLIEHEKAFKKLWKEKEALINENSKLNIELKKIKGKIFNLRFLIDKIKKEKRDESSTISRKGSIFHLRRLMIHMEIGKEYSRKSLAQEMATNISEIDTALKFLTDFNLIKIEHRGLKFKRL